VLPDFLMFMKEVSYAHQGCMYLIKKHLLFLSMLNAVLLNNVVET